MSSTLKQQSILSSFKILEKEQSAIPTMAPSDTKSTVIEYVDLSDSDQSDDQSSESSILNGKADNGSKIIANVVTISRPGTIKPIRYDPISRDRTISKSKRKICPTYKRIQGTNFTVDCFDCGQVPHCSAYFLSHYHWDHYRGLTKNFKGHIYCSQITANLLITHMKVQERLVHVLPMNKPCLIEDVTVILLESNHCPGAVMFLFELPSGVTHLHTGDFRASDEMLTDSLLCSRQISHLYLDTTYCDPDYSFPTQSEMIDLSVELALEAFAENKRTLFVCGTYTIGKEKVFAGNNILFTSIAEALDCRIFMEANKRRILQCLEWPELTRRVTTSVSQAQLHIVSLHKMNFKQMTQYLDEVRREKWYDRLVGFEPTGWTQGRRHGRNPKTNKENIKIYSIPYSEHSSYSELMNFVTQLKPETIIPTVDCEQPEKMKCVQQIFDSWFESSCRS